MTHVFGPNELLEDVLGKGLCIGCGACVDLCPYFKNYRGKTAMLFPCTSPQGRCHAFCPKTEVDLDALAARFWGGPYEGTPLGKHREVRIARAGSRMPAGNFQAGGTASSLVAFAMETRRIDAAVLTGHEGLVPVSGLATRTDEVLSHASSKYMAAPTLSALNQGVARGYRRLGVVGTPCQLTAVAQMRSNPLRKDDFQDPVALTVGLFCTWSLDTRDLMAFLSPRLDISRIRKMDIPPPPSEILVIETETETVTFPLNEIRPLVPDACRICPDMTAEWSDVSVGVMEGRPGWNTLIIRSEAGAYLVEEAEAAGYLTTGPMPGENRIHLCLAAANKKKRSLALAREKGLLNTIPAGSRAAIRLREDTVERIMAADTEETCH
jgi:coenzyme F420 hydrogenase subunit beta